MDTLTIDYTDKNFNKNFVKSLKNTGFAVIKNHHIDDQLIEKVYSDWKKFFLSDEKHNYLFDYDKQDGYFPFKSENAHNSKRKDLKEFYHIYPNWGRYPKSISQDTLILFKELFNLGNNLLDSIDKYSPQNISKNYSEPLNKMYEKSNQNLMRVIHYPPILESDHPEEIRANEHTDINLITLLVSGSEPGLQVKDKDNNWVDIKSKKGQIVVNIGDMLQEASNDFFPSTKHRVINPKKNQNKSRFSIPLFLHPRADVILSKEYTAESYLLERLKEIGLK
jgi:isopenicillin N synthase-like dioxygenase